MKKIGSLVMVAVLGGAISLGMFTLFFNQNAQPFTAQPEVQVPLFKTVASTGASLEMSDFTVAAEKTIHSVVHVKNVQLARQPRNFMEYLQGGGDVAPALAGTGSGVIISEDGYIVTNNHVINGASQIEVTLNDNRQFMAEVVGTDPKADIALLKVDANNALPYITFGDSDTAQVGEWVLAVGNPFNLTSTVTAGIISAKARDINERDQVTQSFIQTDAAINPGNSGGALVNINGELIGINTAISSQTGSYVGYAFAVPSNNARKIVSDILEFGAVQRGILGVTGGSLNAAVAEQLGVDEIEGVYVSGAEKESGAGKAGLKEGDVITQVDNIRIRKFADLTGYLNTKRVDETVRVTYVRDGKKRTVPVQLLKYNAPVINTLKVEKLGVELRDATPEELDLYDINEGVVIDKALSRTMKRYGVEGKVIAEIDDKKVGSVAAVRKILEKKPVNEPLSILFVDANGERNRYIFN